MNKLSVLFLLLLLIISVSLYSGYSSNVPDEIEVTERNIYEDEQAELKTVLEEYHGVQPKRRYRKLGKLELSRKDVRLEKDPKGTYFDLVIRKKDHVNSILLTNYYWDHNRKKIREYGLRALRFNWVNGEEQRLYKNIFIGKKQGLYFLVDSTPEEDRYFGEAFRIRLPKYVVYGYKKGSEIYGILRIKDGLKLNIRTFTRKFADYKGKYKDNPIVLVLNDRPLAIKDHPVITKIKEVLEDNYVGTYVQYESKNEFFKSFLVREENEKNFSEIGFHNTSKEHRKAVLLEANYKGGEGRNLRAIIYFKRENRPKTYYITAMDKNGVHSVGRVTVKVPAIDNQGSFDSSFPDQPQNYDSFDESGDYWYNEGEF